jgi:hypothetical protein
MPPTGEGDDVLAVLDEVRARVTELDDRLGRLQAELTEEVRSRRVVVVGDDGFPRVEITARGAFGHVSVHGRTQGPSSTCVELFANDPADSDGAEVGLALSVDGDVVATLHVLQGRQPALWIEGLGEPFDGADDLDDQAAT